MADGRLLGARRRGALVAALVLVLLGALAAAPTGGFGGTGAPVVGIPAASADADDAGGAPDDDAEDSSGGADDDAEGSSDGTEDDAGGSPGGADDDAGGSSDGLDAGTSPSTQSTGERTAVEGELAPDGSLETARLLRHEGDDGAVTERVEELDPADVPVAVRVRYELDGQPVAAEELRGATGEAVVRVQLRNPSTSTREVTLEDDEEPREVEVSTPLVADARLDLDDSWHEVTTEAGRAAPVPERGTQVRWSTALFSPLAEPTTELAVRGRVEGASLPELEIIAQPIAAAADDVLSLLEEQATQAGTTEAVAAFLADAIDQGLEGAAEGAGGLAEGLEQTVAGARELNQGMSEMQRQLEAGAAELEQGLAQLDQGLAELARGLAELESGVAEFEAALREVSGGLEEARDGVTMLRDEVAEPAEAAVRETWSLLAEDFTVGRADPRYADALETVGELYGRLTGEDPTTGEQARASFDGLATTLDELASGLGEAVTGTRELADGAAEMENGLADMRAGVGEMRSQLDQAGGDDLLPGGAGEGQDLDAVLGEFERGLRELASGGDELAGGLRELEDGGEQLLGQLESDVSDTREDLAQLEALAQRAGETGEGTGAYDHYRFVLAAEQPSRAPGAAMAAAIAVAGLLELLRRRLVAG